MQQTELPRNSLSIGILSYKRTDLLLETLLNIADINISIDLIIVNNNEDFCIKNDINNVIKDNSGINLVYISDNINYGVAVGRRKIIEECQTDYIIMLDDDVYIDDINSIVTNSMLEFEKDSDVKGVAFNIKEYSSKKHNRYEIPHKNKNVNMNERFFTYIMIGAGHALHVPTVRKVGNYPDDFGLYGFEEVDLSFRIINDGNKIVYNPKCMVEHKKSPDGRFSNNAVNKLAFVNRTRMAKRYFSFFNFSVCYIVRGGFFLVKTKDISEFIDSSKTIFLDKKKNKFSSYFYKYVNSVNGFLWW